MFWKGGDNHLQDCHSEWFDGEKTLETVGLGIIQKIFIRDFYLSAYEQRATRIWIAKID
jgi:hypothetical protein